MSPLVKSPLRAAAAVLVLLAGVTSCSSSLPSGSNGGGGGGTAGSTGSGGTGGATGALCGGGAACPPGQGCLWECFGDGPPRCVSLPTACDSVSKPVCGCDGKTYGNECLLQSVPIVKDHDGQCVFTAIPPPGDASLLTGVWSGTGIRMNVTPTGAAISFGCASGTIDEPLNVVRRSYTVNGPLPRYGSWQGTMSGAGVAPASVTYQVLLSGATLMLSVMEQSWTLRYEDIGAPACP